VAELVSHYTKNELPNKSPYGQEVYQGYLNTWIVPKWGNYSLADVRTVANEAWLGTLKQLANGTQAKLRKIMSATFAHAMRWEVFDRNPITLVRQSAKRQREPEVLRVSALRRSNLASPRGSAGTHFATRSARCLNRMGKMWRRCNLSCAMRMSASQWTVISKR
jgi:hypothetical protein